MMLWKSKGTDPVISPEGDYIAYVRSGQMIVESTVRNVELLRVPEGMNPQWWAADEVAYRKVGQSYFWTFDVRAQEYQRREAAPGAVFLCRNRKWCSWEKKTGRLWMNGVVVGEGAERPVYMDEDGMVHFTMPSPPRNEELEEFAGAAQYSWTRTKGGLVVVALEIPTHRLKIYVEEYPLEREPEVGDTGRAVQEMRPDLAV